MRVTSPARLGAPGRVRIAPRLVTMAASSTKVESGNSGSGGSRTQREPQTLQRPAVGLVLLQRERQVGRAEAG